MDFSIKLSLISVILFVLCVYSEAAKQLPCNNETINEVDKIIAKINPIGNSKMRFPESVGDAKKYCKTLLNPIVLLDDLNKRCMKGMMKEVVGIVLYGVKKKRRSMCKKHTTGEIKELVDTGKCVNEARFELERCANKSLDKFMGMEDVDSDLKIPLACCEINVVKRCLLNSLGNFKSCSDKNEETLVGHYQGLSGGALKIACNEFKENSDRCAQLKSVKLKPRAGRRRAQSLVLPVIRLFESLDNAKD